MTTLYGLSFDEVYLVYSTKEKQQKAKEIQIDRLKDIFKGSNPKFEQMLIDSIHNIEEFEIKEGEAFGEGLNVDHQISQDITLD